MMEIVTVLCIDVFLWYFLSFNLGTISFLSLAWRVYAQFATHKHASFKDLHEKINSAKKTGLRVAVIGSGISGVQAMKACLEEGIEPVCFESDSKIGGFWRFKPGKEHPSVYQSTHIDTPRELNGYSDRPYDFNEPVLLHNSRVAAYVMDNAKEFDLVRRIRFNTRVDFVSPKAKAADGHWTWEVSTTTVDLSDPTKKVSNVEVFDGVMVCTGRHGGGGYIPNFSGLSDFKGKWFHSSQYKDPSTHDIEGKKVVVVGIGNSGLDIVTEVSKYAKDTILVSRSGAWVSRASQHGEQVYASAVQDRLTAFLSGYLPWWVMSDVIEKVGLTLDSKFPDHQAILNKHGLKPQHRFFQQHMLVTGLHDPEYSLHDQLERGRISVKHGIQEFTPDGIIFTDDASKKEVTQVDIVIFATGYRQVANFIDPKVVDMRFEREGNDVVMYKYIYPISEYTGLGFINFVQSATFLCADIQSRHFVQTLLGNIRLPPISVQKKEAEDIRQALCAQYIDRQQLRIQEGLYLIYYDELAMDLGCYPSVLKLLIERPTALWHGWLADWQAPQYRLVGKGRLENVEKWIEQYYNSRYLGNFPDGTVKPLPKNRGHLMGYVTMFGTYAYFLFLLAKVKYNGFKLSRRFQDKLDDYVAYAKHDTQAHSLKIGDDSSDVKQLGKKIAAYRD